MDIKNIYIRDPFILFDTDIYYMYGKEYVNQKGFVVYKSKDLEEWSEAKKIFNPDKNFWADRDFWAPEVHIYKNKYYMIASFKSSSRKRGSQILVSDSPDGDFKPITEYPVTPEEWECLDGTLYIDRFGNPHIVFCHEWEQGGIGSVCEMSLSNDLKEAVSNPRVLWHANDYEYATNAFSHTKSLVTDGPCIYRMKNGELICLWATFTKLGYTEVVARSDNGDIDGNWTVDKAPLLDISGGHGMIFKSKSDKPMFVMHSPNDAGFERAKIFEFYDRKKHFF